MSKPLNVDMIEELKAIMEDEFPSLVQTFLEESENQFLGARTAWEKNDVELLRRSVHSLKGSCGNIGAEDLHEVCDQLERKVTQGDTACVGPALLQIENNLQLVCEAIRVI